MPITVSTQKEVTLDIILKENPDLIVLAIGALLLDSYNIGNSQQTNLRAL